MARTPHWAACPVVCVMAGHRAHRFAFVWRCSCGARYGGALRGASPGGGKARWDLQAVAWRLGGTSGGWGRWRGPALLSGRGRPTSQPPPRDAGAWRWLIGPAKPALGRPRSPRYAAVDLTTAVINQGRAVCSNRPPPSAAPKSGPIGSAGHPQSGWSEGAGWPREACRGGQHDQAGTPRGSSFRSRGGVPPSGAPQR